MNVRHRLVPQMLEYDRLGVHWLPYLMFFHPPRYSSPTVNTDERGFRVNYYNGKIIHMDEHFDSPVSILVGGSTAFGVGASSDQSTLSACLTEKTGQPWLNFGGRAYSSVQEILLFQLYNQTNNIQKILLFSGMNDLILPLTTTKSQPDLGTFFFSSTYQTKMNEAGSWKRKVLAFCLRWYLGDGVNFDRASLREILAHLRRGPGQPQPALEPDPTRSVDQETQTLRLLRRNLTLWKEKSVARGFELTYVLQPFADWIEREPAQEEIALFDFLNGTADGFWRKVKNEIASKARYRWYKDGLSRICDDLGIRFHDMNESLSNTQYNKMWLFVDRVHLTDLGNKVVSDLLIKEKLC